MTSSLRFVLLLALLAAPTWTEEAAPTIPAVPVSLFDGAKVVTLWPAGHPTLKDVDQKEVIIFDKANPKRIEQLNNVHNPSIELHLAAPEKANGAAVIIAVGGGNRTLCLDEEGMDVYPWLNDVGISAFILRYRLAPHYRSDVEALADTQRAFRTIRNHAKEWGVDPERIGIMGFSAGGEQAALAALKFDAGNSQAADPIERESCRPNFSVLVYAGWKKLDMNNVPKNAPPIFVASAGVGDAFHARLSIQFYSAFFEAKIPSELHIYGQGRHGGGISSREGIPYGTWHLRFAEWAKDLRLMEKTSAR
jgi:alpha/beta hydrolase fold